jgi:hypothetical protein
MIFRRRTGILPVSGEDLGETNPANFDATSVAIAFAL